MRNTARARWIAGFDIEPLMSAILRNGLLLSMGLIVAGLVVQSRAMGRLDFGYMLQAGSVPEMLQNDLQRVSASDFRSRLLLDMGVSALMITSYLRVLASMVYFAFVDCNRTNLLFTAIVFIILTIVLLTTLV